MVKWILGPSMIVVLLFVWYDSGAFTLWLRYVMVPPIRQSTASLTGMLLLLLCVCVCGFYLFRLQVCM